ncbi:T-lymphocyte surface antigen Ly-9-like isoform X1 [Ammospiza nelsoni]|uniref:T-lymphocyte surface antigen Ly-9-like isoform X1 n=1 Tax=Ammospiza nelsoni TaxID=2857394 RepID=UPI00286A8B96|nr:T-lymphocyte surface antigen Ly-9-like isoform X1 [Ammospiza nelsoni]
MDVFWIPHLAILMLLHQTMSASDTKEVNGVLGKSVTFQSHNPDRMTALWFFGNEAIVTVIFDGPLRPAFHKKEFRTRFSVSKSGHALTISQLRMEDAGTYSVTINGEKSAFTLQVFRELAEPTVTCEAQNCSNGSCSSSLRCSAPGAGLGNVSYTWRVGDQNRYGSSVVLLVNETSQDGLEPLTCTARNPVSNESVTITNLGELCTGALSSSQVGVRAGVGLIVVILVLVLLLIFLLFLWKSKGWTKFPLSQPRPADTVPGATNDYTTVYAEVGPSQQSVPDGTKAKPAEGGPPSTIYSLVKRPEQADGGTAENATVTGLELV